MKAKVVQIQVGGGPIASSLEDAIRMWHECPPDRKKLHFLISIGERLESITIRDEEGEEGTFAYGSFAGLQDALTYAVETLHGEEYNCATCEEIKHRPY